MLSVVILQASLPLQILVAGVILQASLPLQMLVARVIFQASLPLQMLVAGVILQASMPTVFLQASLPLQMLVAGVILQASIPTVFLQASLPTLFLRPVCPRCFSGQSAHGVSPGQTDLTNVVRCGVSSSQQMLVTVMFRQASLTFQVVYFQGNL